MDSSREEIEKETTNTTTFGPNDVTHIVKGKRTKRQRPQSPIPFTITTHSSTGAGADNVRDYMNSSAANSAGTTTEEDEDTAKCLILLSQGPSPESPNIINNNYNHNDEELGTTYKFTSKRYIETSTTGNGKAGIYVYECKTCNRTFPSFQALGGHRASHKKPKATATEDRKRPLMALSDEEEPQFKNYYYSSGLSLHLGNRPALYSNTNNNNNNNSKLSGSKVHECAICGAEFTSGQALGGHMRRHRGPVVAAGGGGGGGGANTTLSLSPSSPPIGIIDHEESNNNNKKKKKKNGFCLDLNLPAAPEPEEEGVNNGEATTSIASAAATANFSKQKNQTTTTHHHHQQQQQQKQQSPLVLSAAPTLVDCHY